MKQTSKECSDAVQSVRDRTACGDSQLTRLEKKIKELTSSHVVELERVREAEQERLAIKAVRMIDSLFEEKI